MCGGATISVPPHATMAIIAKTRMRLMSRLLPPREWDITHTVVAKTVRRFTTYAEATKPTRPLKVRGVPMTTSAQLVRSPWHSHCHPEPVGRLHSLEGRARDLLLSVAERFVAIALQ